MSNKRHEVITCEISRFEKQLYLLARETRFLMLVPEFKELWPYLVKGNSEFGMYLDLAKRISRSGLRDKKSETSKTKKRSGKSAQITK